MIQRLEEGYCSDYVQMIDFVRTTEGNDIEKVTKLEWPTIKLYRCLKSDGMNSHWIVEISKTML